MDIVLLAGAVRKEHTSIQGARGEWHFDMATWISFVVTMLWERGEWHFDMATWISLVVMMLFP